MPSFGYSFDRAYLDAPLPRRDSDFTQIIRAHADALLAELPPIDTFSEMVRRLIPRQSGNTESDSGTDR